VRRDDAAAILEEQYRRVFEDAPIGMFRTDPDGRLLAANPALAQLLGYDSPGQMAAAISDVAHELWAKPVDRAQEQSFVRRVEGELKCRDGELVSVSVTTRKVTGPDGTTLHYESYVEDLTHQKALRRAQQELHERDRQIATIYESVGEALFLLSVEPSEQYRFLTINPTFLRMTGLTTEQVAGKLVTQVIPEPSLSLVLTKYSEAIAKRSIVRWEETTTFPTGTKCGDVSVTPIFGADGVCTHLMGAVHDTTEGRRTAVEKEHLREQLRQAQKLESVGRLAGGVAHDFNNILVVINGYAALLASRLSPFDPLREYVLEIAKAGDHAASLTSQLLAFSRKQVIRPLPLDLNAVVRDAERMLRRLIGEDIEFVIQPAAEPAWVMADHAQIQQVIVNLAANARDAMPNGGTLRIATASIEVDEELAAAYPGVAPGSHVLTTFTDTGAGMPEEVRQNIFEPFFTTKDQGKGIGLGLATVYGIVRQSGGWIEVESRVGEGTSFQIYLPRIHPFTEPASSDARAPDKATGGATVLVVEDQEAVRRLTKLTLGSLGYHVLEAESAARACELASAYPGEIHLLLTDIVMPGVNGRELATKVQRLRPHLKVLLMSGYAEEEILPRGLAELELAFLPKPFTQDALAAKVREVLGEVR
jgi:PAS domain S-box-containing protein